MEPTQVLLIVVITILTMVLTVIGVQLFLILKEIRKSVYKINQILDDTVIVSNTVASSVSGFSGILTGIKTGLSVINIFKQKEKVNGEEK